MLLEWHLKMIRMKSQKKLNEKNLALFKSITVYMQNSNLTGAEKEEALQQIMDMILQAQVENKPVELVLGNDYEEFCKSVIEEYNNKNKIYKTLDLIQKYIVWVLAVITVMAAAGGIRGSTGFSITISQLILANYIALVIVPLSRKYRQKSSSLSLYQRLGMNANLQEGATAVILGGFAMIIIRFIIKGLYGADVYDYNINLMQSLLYIVLILFMAGAIELYKRAYAGRQVNG